MNNGNKGIALLLAGFAAAAIIMGLALGLTKGYQPSDSEDDSAIIDCGRPFMINDADLTNYGLASCEADGGLGDRRANAFGFIGAGIALGAFAGIAARTTSRSAPSASATSFPTPPTSAPPSA